MKKYLATAALALLATVGVSGPALAGSHVIPAYGTEQITFYTCPGFQLVADGDNDTDLDFVLYDPVGRQIRSDYDETDLMIETVNYGRCGTYRLEVENLGSVWNRLDVSVIR